MSAIILGVSEIGWKTSQEVRGLVLVIIVLIFLLVNIDKN